MARHSQTFLLSALMLSVGLAIGGHLDGLRLTSDVHAVPENTAAPVMMPGSEALVFSGQHIKHVAQEVVPAAVHIQAVRNENGRRVEETGSGVLMRSPQVRGLFVITNNHVVRGAANEAIDVGLSDGQTIHPLRVYRDTESDLAVLQVRDNGQTSGRWGNSDDLEIGHFVLAVGSPFGLSQSITMGIVSAKGRRDLSLTEDRSVTNQDFIQTDAAINPGNSGGPLIDMQGNVVGINTAIASNSGGNEGIGFSIPSVLVRRVFKHLVTYGKVRRAYLGVELDNNFTTETARRLGMERAIGARITRVYQSSRPTPAAVSGLRPDDVILMYNGVAVQDENHLIHLVSLTDIGTAVRVEIFRSKRRQLVSMQLTDRDNHRTAEDLSGLISR
jgi:serine protease Do